MQWWAWVTVGAVLLGSELAFVDAQFYLVFLGAAALVVGVLDLSGWLPMPWSQWLVFAALAASSMVAFRRRIYDRLRYELPVMNHGPVGEYVVLPSALPPGERCRVELRGSTWNAVNGGAAMLDTGARARVERVDGLTLVIRGE